MNDLERLTDRELVVACDQLRWLARLASVARSDVKVHPVQAQPAFQGDRERLPLRRWRVRGRNGGAVRRSREEQRLMSIPSRVARGKLDIRSRPRYNEHVTGQELVQQIKAHALNHYSDGGWDVVAECWSDADIAEQIAGARTLRGAIRKFNDIISVYADRQADARNSAF
jgi:hypothetical protein